MNRNKSSTGFYLITSTAASCSPFFVMGISVGIKLNFAVLVQCFVICRIMAKHKSTQRDSQLGLHQDSPDVWQKKMVNSSHWQRDQVVDFMTPWIKSSVLIWLVLHYTHHPLHVCMGIWPNNDPSRQWIKQSSILSDKVVTSWTI